MNQSYIHDKKIHNTKAAAQIVPLILKLYNPESVIDIGCGIGTWGKVFEENGIFDYIGVDGDYVNRKLLMIDEGKFLVTDLRSGFSIARRFDIALSLEVAEHLPEGCADVFIKSLINLSDTIIFSAAIKGQGGQNHLNEQFPEYWHKKFKDFNYSLIYCFSSEIWNNKNVDWWYQQNMFVYKKKDVTNAGLELRLFVHPELYKMKLYEISILKEQKQNLLIGKIPLKQAFKIFVKAILHFANRFLN